jgi:hypothetical protein
MSYAPNPEKSCNTQTHRLSIMPASNLTPRCVHTNLPKTQNKLEELLFTYPEFLSGESRRTLAN